jgi:putative transposase
MTHWRTYYHLVWATHNRQPLITPDHEPLLYKYLYQKATQIDAYCHAIGGMPDHIHVIASIPPKLSIASFVKTLKSSSSKYLNESITKSRFTWQREYGVFSLGELQLDRAIAYANAQKRHHAELSVIRSLEIIE